MLEGSASAPAPICLARIRHTGTSGDPGGGAHPRAHL